MMLAMTLILVQVYVKDVFLVHAFSAQHSRKQCEVGAMQRKERSEFEGWFATSVGFAVCR